MTEAQQIQTEEFVLPVKRVTGETVEDRLTENAYERILPARYLLKDESGEVVETPKELFRRVAENVALPDKEYRGEDGYEKSAEAFFEIMTNLEFIPNSPTLMNAGAELQQLSACFVVHPKDDMDSIFSAVHDAAKIFQTGGGLGYPFHLLRPKGDVVKSTGGIASGPLSFQHVFDTMCGTIKQGGKRRGAQMGIMRVDHPDVLRFIVSKRKEGSLSNFNISVGLTDGFMEAVKNDEAYTLINPRTGEPHEVSQQTAEFYNTGKEWYPEASGSDTGKDDNFWRDFANEFPQSVREYDIALEPGEEMKLPARFIWECLVDGAWKNGEPGLFMYDEANRMHSFDVDKHPEHRMEATNPCGEQPLENYEACNLGHINLSLLVAEKEDGQAHDFAAWRSNHPEYDYETEEGMQKAVRAFLQDALRMDRLEYLARTGTRFLDNVVTMSDFPLEEIEETVSSLRKVGLGLMGFAQMLIQLGVRYGSRESMAVAREIQRLITRFSVKESHELAKERGPFPAWEESKWATPTDYADWFEQYTGGMNPADWEDGLKLRNHNTTTIAPTGTTSMIANTSGGCEPIYSLAYFKNVAKDIQGEDMLVEFDDYFLKALEANDVDVDAIKEKAEELMRNNEWDGVNSIPDDILPPAVKNLFVTADRVTPEEHVRIQTAFQTYNHSAISKTCNFPNDASREDIAKAYMLAYERGAKGLTVYRDGTRDVQVMTTRAENRVEDAESLATIIEEEFGSMQSFLRDLDLDHRGGKRPRERPATVVGTTQKVNTGYGSLFVTVNEDEHGIFEVFANVGKSGGFVQSLTEAIGRLISLALRSGVDPSEVVDQLSGIRSPAVAWDRGVQIHSIPDAIAKALERYMGGDAQTAQKSMAEYSDTPAADKSDVEVMVDKGINPECPDCGSMLSYQEGCVTCESCGYSECG